MKTSSKNKIKYATAYSFTIIIIGVILATLTLNYGDIIFIFGIPIDLRFTFLSITLFLVGFFLFSQKR